MALSHDSPIFIVGMPRSGTTLLTSILSAHPRLGISPESHYLSYWIPNYRHLNLADKQEFQQFWQTLSTSRRFSYFDVDAEIVLARIRAEGGSPCHRTVFTAWMTAYAERIQKPRWGEKTPLHYQHLPQLLSWFPQAQILWMIRDPRAVAASLLDMTWASDYVHIHARQWCESTQLFETSWSQDPRVRLVAYERLVQSPQAVVKELLEFLQEDYVDNLIRQRSTDAMPIVNRQGWALAHLSQALQPLSTGSIDRWRQRLSPSQQAIVNHLTDGVRQRYGYGDPSDLPLSRRAAAVLRWAELRWRLDRKAAVWRTRLWGKSSRRAREIGAVSP